MHVQYEKTRGIFGFKKIQIQMQNIEGVLFRKKEGGRE
jgi:hypothetical protein